MRHLIAVLFCFAILPFATTAARADGCPPFSAPAPGHENDDVVPCTCVPGFAIRDGKCRPASAKPQPVMRAMTPAECADMEAGLKADKTNGCTSRFYDCLTGKGMNSDSAWCAASLLLLGSSRTRENAAGALITCGQQAQAFWRACTAGWESCTADAAHAYEARVQSCQAR